MASLTIENDKYKYSPKGRGVVTLPTAGTFVDRNIVIDDQAGTYVDGGIAVNLTVNKPTVAIENASTGLSFTDTASASTDYQFNITGTTTASGKVTSTESLTAGYYDETDLTREQAIASTSSGKQSVTKYIKQSTLDKTSITPGAQQTVTIGAGYYPSARTVTVKAASTGTAATLNASATGSATISTVSVGTLNSTTNTYPITGSASITGTANAGTQTSGYATAGTTKATGSTTGTANVNASIAAATIGVNATDPGTSYTENTTAVVPTGGYLTIGAGYMPNTKISLKTLVPNEADLNASTGADYIRTGHTAYDNDGNLITGTINDVSLKAGSTTITSDYLTTTNTGYPVKASGSVSVDTGYIEAGSKSSTEATKYVKAVGAATLAITDKASTELTPGTLSDGYFPINTSLTGKMTFASAGWIGTGGASATDSSVAVGKIKQGSVTISGSVNATTPSIQTGTAATTAKGTAISSTPTTTVPTDTSKYYIAVKANAPATTVTLDKSVTAGYLADATTVTASASTKASASGTYYLPVTGAGSLTKGLQTSTDATNYPSGYSSYRVTAPLGYRASAAYADIPVFQGIYSVA